MSTGLLFVFLKNNIQVSYMHFKDQKKTCDSGHRPN
jgi:hypothetical protein